MRSLLLTIPIAFVAGCSETTSKPNASTGGSGREQVPNINTPIADTCYDGDWIGCWKDESDLTYRFHDSGCYIFEPTMNEYASFVFGWVAEGKETIGSENAPFEVLPGDLVYYMVGHVSELANRNRRGDLWAMEWVELHKNESDRVETQDLSFVGWYVFRVEDDGTRTGTQVIAVDLPDDVGIDPDLYEQVQTGEFERVDCE